MNASSEGVNLFKNSCRPSFVLKLAFNARKPSETAPESLVISANIV